MEVTTPVKLIVGGTGPGRPSPSPHCRGPVPRSQQASGPPVSRKDRLPDFVPRLLTYIARQAPGRRARLRPPTPTAPAAVPLAQLPGARTGAAAAAAPARSRTSARSRRRQCAAAAAPGAPTPPVRPGADPPLPSAAGWGRAWRREIMAWPVSECQACDSAQFLNNLRSRQESWLQVQVLARPEPHPRPRLMLRLSGICSGPRIDPLSCRCPRT
ncbi:NADH-quinone oxidoreductase subunit I 2-like [Hypanus sabinus]|uniref:NADH-quinone oxidoreductase subunit I 2-like n=1 Tax=Hypanus sabinus TaxID=79690 RepID=UPI0028C49F8E|nr:NADH-quinone oxidoreductase subunit I 2-like [Hypanus sabinus]